MSKDHKLFEVFKNSHTGELYVETDSGEKFRVLDQGAQENDRNYFLLGKFTYNGVTYNYALNMEVNRKKRQITPCPSPDSSGTQTDNRPPSPLITSLQSISSTDYFVIKCSDGYYGELLLIDERKIPSGVKKWTWYDFELDPQHSNRIRSIKNIVHNVWVP